MPRNYLTFRTDEKVFYNFDEAIINATTRAVYSGKSTTILVVPLNDLGAYQWGQDEAVAKWQKRESDDEPLASINIKGSASYWR